MKINKPAKAPKERFFDNKRNLWITGIVTAAVLLLVVVLMFIESGNKQYMIENKTNLKLEYVKAYFVYSEGKVNDGIELTDLSAHVSKKLPMEPIDLLGLGANLEVRFKFENYDELFVDAGIFDDSFQGKVSIVFEETEDPGVLDLKVKANNGLMPSTLINCDEEYIVNLNEGFIPE